jgi:hypothetical protein
MKVPPNGAARLMDDILREKTAGRTPKNRQ